MEGLPTWLQIVLVVGGLFGVKELALAAVNYATGKRKANADLDALQLTNDATRLSQLEVATSKVEELLAKAEAREQRMAQLNRELATEKERVIAKDAIIEYQREENRQLYEAMSRLREEMAILRKQMDDMARAQEELTQQSMRQTAVLQKLQKEGKWEGFPPTGTIGS